MQSVWFQVLGIRREQGLCQVESRKTYGSHKKDTAAQKQLDAVCVAVLLSAL